MKKVIASLAERVDFGGPASKFNVPGMPHTIGVRWLNERPVKEVAKLIRKELKERFPECKWSVRVRGCTYSDSVDIELQETPYGKEATQAIASYAELLHDAYNYNDSDTMTDYFDVGYYGGVSYHWAKKVDPTEEQKTWEDTFLAFQKEKAEREELERIAKAEEEARHWEEVRIAYAAEREANAEKIREIDERLVVTELPDAIRPHVAGLRSWRKINSLKEAEEDWAENVPDTVVTEIVTMNDNDYEFFQGHLMEDWGFLAGKGGSGTDDPRVNEIGDWMAMDNDERKTVVWYELAIAILDGKGNVRMYVNPHGHNYARYVMLPAA